MQNAQQNIAAFAAATNNELFDADYKGGKWMIDAVETSETIDQIIDSAKGWAEKSTANHGVIAGFPFVAYAKMQARRGDARRSLSVVDFGDVRYVLECNLSHYACQNFDAVVALLVAYPGAVAASRGDHTN